MSGPGMSVRAALAAAAARLAAAGVPDVGRDVRLLMADALGVGPDRVTLALGDPLAEAAAARFAAHVAARADRRPVSQILGRRAFWSHEFLVTADVLDPRPETELLVALALEGPAPRRLLDIGVGSGAILATLLAAWPAAQGVGTDLSAPALAVARANADRLGVGPRADLVAACWAEGVAGPFDLVVSNPPYIAEAEMAGLSPEVLCEPRMALTPGGDGLAAYRAIAADLDRLLAAGGRSFFEIGATQGAAVAAIFAAAGFAAQIHPDLGRRDRVVAVRRPEPAD